MSWELDETQREAVEAAERAVMVVAGPGTGKTRVLTARAAWLTEVQGVDPSRILAITYTNRAAAEMRSRLISRGDDADSSTDPAQGRLWREEGGRRISPASEIPVFTFHSWAYRLVRKYAQVLEFPREPAVFDEDAQERLLLRLLGRKRIPQEAIPIRYLKQLIDRVKAEAACPIMDERYDLEHFELVMDLLRSYQEELQSLSALDFADILLNALRLLYIHPDIRAEITSSIDHLLIDEFQDINHTQYRLIDALERPEMSLFAVGDEDQTIYAFRGSSGVFIDQFVADFGARLIPLGNSYRCSDALLYAAASVISKNRRFYQRPPRPPRGIAESPPISLFELENEDEEGKVAAKLIKSWVESGCSYRDIAVLYRVHNIADECESALISSGIPVLRLHPERQREQVPGDPVPLLRLAVLDTDWDWDASIGLPRDRLGELDDLRVRLAAIADGIPLHTLLGRPARFRHLSALARFQLARLSRFVKELRKMAQTEAPSALLSHVVEHLRDSRTAWLPVEDDWLAAEEETIAGFGALSIGAILEEWGASKDGIRILHAPTITALLAATLLGQACSEIMGVEADARPLPFSLDDSRELPVDTRPACMIGLAHPADMLFPSGTLLPQALYVSSSGVSNRPPASSDEKESFPLMLAAHRLAAELVAFRPGGGEEETLVFFDLETTGVETYRAEIVEIAAVKVLLKEGEARELGHFRSLVKPRGQIPATATAVHGIRDQDVADSPPLEEILPRFLDFIGDAPLAGHNIDSFDIPLLAKYAGSLLNRVVPNLTLDTLPLAKRLFPGEPHRLEILAERFGLEVETAHRALDDVRTNIAVFNGLIALDETSRARAFSPDVPLALALAHAVDEDTEVDPAFLAGSAFRALAARESDPEKHPFFKSLSPRLSTGARSGILGLLHGLARGSFELTSTGLALEARIQILRDEALRLEDERGDVTLGEYLAHIALLTDIDFDSEEDAVRMMSLHAAKGLEYDRVMILGLEQGSLPHWLALNKTVAEIEEERKLFYVGLTRARARAALVYLRRRMGRWRGKSMFLSDLPKNSFRTFRTKDRVSGR